MKELILVRGLSGSGKTTAAKIFAGSNWPVLSNDDWFESKEEYKFSWKDWERAKRFCQERTAWRMNLEEPKIYVANTFATEGHMKPYFDLAEKYGYKVFSVIIENRHGNKNVHNVPENVIEEMTG